MTGLIDPEAARRAAVRALRPGDLFGELFAEERTHVAHEIRDGMPITSRTRYERGMGLRAVDDTGTRLAHHTGLDEDTLPALVSALRSGGPVTGTRDRAIGRPWPVLEGAHAATVAAEAEAEARAAGNGHDVQVTVKVITLLQQVLVARPDRVVTERREAVSLHIRAKVRLGKQVRWGRRVTGCDQLAGLVKDGRHRLLARAAVESAIERLDAVDAPAGRIPVVLGPGSPAMLLHEACGHALEGDLVRRPASAFHGRFGSRVAVPHLSLVDDPRQPGDGRQYGVDDEGEPAATAVLIEGGVLTGQLLDRWHAHQLGIPGNGHGRRLSYAYPPLPRMASTVVAPGPHAAGEIVAATPRGLYVRSIGGGDTDMGSGRFNLQVDEGYLIENGRLGPPIRGAVLSGTGSEVLAGIDMVGDDVEMLSGAYVCNKLDQFPVLVNLGQPTLRVAELHVWGV
ncbi:TldD/PmbA family protein [Actinoplanes flavus]|uniref:TldD/PmbA family protein n=1 Tax=Actinoplanes flavus TaxID=2820290 RepID=A0ABS3UH69_9ACTN|nr:TldD/PmbA family protein [Actinoplanes flavus]MBO3738113.1 TldD/PmbA family protein [Actinoplanes flavus]